MVLEVGYLCQVRTAHTHGGRSPDMSLGLKFAEGEIC